MSNGKILKIFEPEMSKYLYNCGVSESEINRIKFEELKKAVIKRLEGVTQLIRDDEWDKITGLLAYSPSGDGMGCDNNYIDFSAFFPDEHSNDDNDGYDIGYICEILGKLKIYETD